MVVQPLDQAHLGDQVGQRDLRVTGIGDQPLVEAKRFLEGCLLPPDRAHVHWNGTFSETQKRALLGAELPAALDRILAELREASQASDDVSSYLWFDQKYFLPDDILMKVDRMSMAHALELRAPFLDTRLLAMAMAMDEADMVTGMPWQEHLKQALRRVARKRLPVAVSDRPKQGFMAPVKHWLRGELAGDIEAMIDAGPLVGLVRPDYVKAEWARHRAGQDRSDMLWALLLMDRWMRQRDWRFD